VISRSPTIGLVTEAGGLKATHRVNSVIPGIRLFWSSPRTKRFVDSQSAGSIDHNQRPYRSSAHTSRRQRCLVSGSPSRIGNSTIGDGGSCTKVAAHTHSDAPSRRPHLLPAIQPIAPSTSIGAGPVWPQDVHRRSSSGAGIGAIRPGSISIHTGRSSACVSVGAVLTRRRNSESTTRTTYSQYSPR
jgi:hypothetical protein